MSVQVAPGTETGTSVATGTRRGPGRARARGRSTAPPRRSPPRVVALCALAAAAYAPVLGRQGNLATEAVRAGVVGAFALAAAFAVVRRPFERQGLLALCGTALGAFARAQRRGRSRPTRTAPV